ncbi:sulfotransferase family protein [Candidatus Woesearchaeota archaeon]|nr:sulfotransferase family protein [Candidatus Woesearchaeota archaeon]
MYMKDNYTNYSYWFLSLLLYGSVDPRFFVIPPKKKIAYLVLPKNACSSIKSSLVPFVKSNHSIHFNDGLSKNVGKLSSDFKSHYSFTFIRNPFERLVSCYVNKFEEYERWDKIFLFEKYYLFGYLKKTDSFAQFVKKVAKLPDFLSDSHFQSQYSRIYRRGKLVVDFIGRMENFSEDFAVLKKKFLLANPPHINKTKKKYSWKDYYTPELARLVYRRYKKECDLWYPEEYLNLLRHLK